MTGPPPTSAFGDSRDFDLLGGTLTLGGDLKVRRLGFGAMRLAGPGV